MLLKFDDPFIRNLLHALGIPTERLRSFAIGGAVDQVVTVEADYLAAGADPEIRKRLELARPAALEGLLSELEGGKIRAIELEEGDTVVFRCPQTLDDHQRSYVRDSIGRSLVGAGHKLLILDGGAELLVVKASDEVLDTSSL